MQETQKSWVQSLGPEEHSNPLQFPCLQNPTDRGAWWATVNRVAKSRTQLKCLSIHAYMCVYIYIWVAIFFNGGYESHGLDCLSPSQLHLPSLYLTLPRFGQVIFHISLYLFASLCCHIDVPFAWTALPHFLLAVKSPFTVLESSCSLQLWAPQRLPVEVPPHETMLRHLCAPSCQCPGEFSERDYAPMPQYSKHRGTNWTRSGSSHFFVMNPLK